MNNLEEVSLVKVAYEMEPKVDISDKMQEAKWFTSHIIVTSANVSVKSHCRCNQKTNNEQKHTNLHILSSCT